MQVRAVPRIRYVASKQLPVVITAAHVFEYRSLDKRAQCRTDDENVKTRFWGCREVAKEVREASKRK